MPLKPEPDQTLQGIHDFGAALGFERVRVDRSQRDRVWFEVGYGCREILVRTSSGTRYRADADKVNMEAVADLLLQLLDGGNWAVHAQIPQREDEK